jgi:DNA-binding response OmpR family regulator
MENVKLLVIDDDAMTCNLLETILQMENYETASLTSIDDSDIIPLLSQIKPDMLLLDLHLGSTATLEYVVAIRADEGWRRLPILMTSAIDYRQACLEAGANDFVLKPFNWQELTQRVNKMRDDLVYQKDVANS